jgi:nitrogen fixation protein FixH
MTPSGTGPRELTGRAVLLWLLGFFGIVFAVNGWLVEAATSTFGGVETQSSYKAGLMFEQEAAKAERQRELDWKVEGTLKRRHDGVAMLDIAVRDAQGRPVGGLTADALLAHPIDSRRDHAIVMSKNGHGTFHGESLAQAGQWELVVDFYRGGERVFRSRERITLR